MKKPKTIILLAVLVYLLSLVVIWQVGAGYALSRTEKLLGQSEKVFVESNCDAVDAILLHSCLEIMDAIGNTAHAVPIERMTELARRYRVDEINVVGADGVSVASTLPTNGIGYDYGSYPQTRPFLELLRGTKFISQPFRCGTTNPDKYRKYLGIPFEDGSGFIQLGLDFDRFARGMKLMQVESLRNWRIGRNGNFDFYDGDGDGFCDYTGGAETDGSIVRSVRNGEAVYVRPFTYAGRRFVSVLPEREHFEDRRLYFGIMVPTLAGIILFLAYFVLKMARAEEIDRRHREAEDAVRCRDLAMARAIQLSAMPSPDVFRRNIFSASFAAVTHLAKEVGGDFYDFYPLDKSRIAFVTADVSGKGISAAMFMMRAKNEIYNALASEHDLAEAVAVANRRLCENNEAEMFVTAWIGTLDVQSGEMEYVNAGHNRPFVRRAGGSVEKVCGKGCRFLGMFPDAAYRVDRLVLAPGDSLFLFTDGVTEAMSPEKELFGERRLCGALAASTAEPGELISTVVGAVSAFASGAEQSDDITVLALVWHGTSGRSRRTFTASEASLASAMEWIGGTIGLVDRKSRARLLNAADEMMTNVISYSGAGEFTVTVENAPGRTRLEFSDAGRSFNPLSHVDPDTHLPLSDRPVGGLGILMSKKLVDSVVYRRESDCNVLSLVKFDKTPGEDISRN